MSPGRPDFDAATAPASDHDPAAPPPLRLNIATGIGVIGRPLAIFLLATHAGTAALLSVVLSPTGNAAKAWAVGGFIVFDLLMAAWLMSQLCHQTATKIWRPLAEAFPGVAPAPDAVRTNFYLGFGIAWLGLGGLAHVAADGRHLHLLPTALLRRSGATPISVPLERLERPRFSWPMGPNVSIAGVPVRVPGWVRPLVGPAPAAGADAGAADGPAARAGT